MYRWYHRIFLCFSQCKRVVWARKILTGKEVGEHSFLGGGLDGQSAGYDKHRFVAVHGGIYCAFELISDNCAGNHFLFPFWAIWSVGKESMFPFLHKIWGIRLSTKGLLLGSLLGGLLMDILPVLFSPVKICSRLCSRPLEWRFFLAKKKITGENSKKHVFRR